jgi:hypothetical protein
MVAAGIGQVVRAALITIMKKNICSSVYFSGERRVKFRDNAEPELPQLQVSL